MRSNVKDGLSIVFISALIIFNCIYLGHFVNLKDEKAEIIEIKQFSETAKCYLPKYLGWIVIPDNNYKKGDKITIPMDATLLNSKNITASMGIIFYCIIFASLFFFIGGFVTIFGE